MLSETQFEGFVAEITTPLLEQIKEAVMDTVYLGQLQVVACWPSSNWGVAGVIMCCHARVNRALWLSGQAVSVPSSSIFLCL
jgi:hypothetical protein